ncbi:MAG: hypothetical protein IK080_09365 [Clostridia bacterium]|nr:hypothetical protein [Clostridia bacterium]
MKLKQITRTIVSLFLTLVLVALSLPVFAADYPGTIASGESIMTAVKANDADSLAAMFSEYVQTKLPDLREKTGRLVQMIDKGIDEYRVVSTYYSDTEIDKDYYTDYFEIEIFAGNRKYLLSVEWITTWKADSKRVGLTSLYLNLFDLDGSLVEYLDMIRPPQEISMHYKEIRDVEPCGWYSKGLCSKLGYHKQVLLSSDPSVATINTNGIIAANGRGTAHITEKYVNEETRKELVFETDVTVTFTTWQTIIWYLFLGFLWY